jgi:glycosyltransferase involved in cell wall biosynthesis
VYSIGFPCRSSFITFLRRMKKVAIEASALAGQAQGGISLYTRQLIQNLCLNREEFRYSLSGKIFTQKRIYSELKMSKSKFHPWIFDIILNPSFDLIHFPDARYPAAGKKPFVITIHDLALFKNDLMKIHGYSSPGFKSKIEKRLKKALSNAAGVICISRNTLNDLREFYPGNLPPHKVIYLGCDHLPPSHPGIEDEILEKFKLDREKFIFFSGLISWRKNIPALIKAFAALNANREFSLVLSGGPGPGFEEIIDLPGKLRIKNKVIFTGFVSEPELSALYNTATGFAFPTFYEGFGLPILEAFSFGLPVLISNTGSAPEIAGGHALLVDPRNQDSLQQGLSELIKGRRNPDRANYAGKFTWKKCAEETKAFYSEILSK